MRSSCCSRRTSVSSPSRACRWHGRPHRWWALRWSRRWRWPAACSWPGRVAGSSTGCWGPAVARVESRRCSPTASPAATVARPTSPRPSRPPSSCRTSRSSTPTARPLWVHGDPPAEAHRESVVDGAGTTLGALLVASTEGPRLSRRDRRALREVLPFVVLVLRAQREAGELRTARAFATTAREDERRRLRRDLHDGVGPLLAGQLLTVDSLRLAAERGARPEDLLAHLEGQARAAITEVRRISRDLQPAALDAGLGPALDSEVERFRTAGLDVRLRHQLPVEPMPAAVEVAVLRIVSESLANVVRHTAARSATVDVAVTDDGIEVRVADDGHGFDDGAAEGVGLVSVRERAEALGGGLEVESGPAGTRVCGRIPL
ncbi:sensor histidine kinase [Kribbella turkmenica]|uniref:histidine kinase n=1 Tax=Kribbella turkmenica TaxID=2530375 RepID=A0A4R4XCP6_9ACTN|nr:sensor histidine kinase [Kribbella turkmenica]